MSFVRELVHLLFWRSRDTYLHLQRSGRRRVGEERELPGLRTNNNNTPHAPSYTSHDSGDLRNHSKGHAADIPHLVLRYSTNPTTTFPLMMALISILVPPSLALVFILIWKIYQTRSCKLAFSSKMDDEIEPFPWLPVIYGKFLKSLHGDYDIETLEWLQWNIDEVIQKLECKRDVKIAKLLLKDIEVLYYHFCTIWSCRNQASPNTCDFSSHMKSTWVHILSSIIKICVLLSRRKEKSKWTNLALNAIAVFPAEKNLIYDALLFVYSLKNQYKPAYGSILKTLLMDMPSFIPATIEDPAEFLKVYLLVRRLKLLIKDRTEKLALQMKASKILAPYSFWDWLLAHGFIMSLMEIKILSVNLWTDICRELASNESQAEIVEALREILLPGLCTERRAEQQGPCVKNLSRKREYVSVTCADQLSSEDDKEIASSEAKNEIKTRINSASMTFSAQVSSEYKGIPAIERKNKSQKRKTCVSVPCTDQILSEDDKEEIAVNETNVKSKKLKRRRNSPQEDASYEKPENISNNVENLNSSVTLVDLQDEDLPAESNSRLKIADYKHASEETEGSSPFRSDQQDPVSEKEMRSSDNQTSINMDSQDCKCEDGDNVISSTIEEHSGHTTQTDEESSRDSAVQTEDLDYSPNQTSVLVENCINCRNIKSDPTSKKLVDGNEKILIQTDFEKEITQRTNISQVVLPVLELHGSPVLSHSSLNGDSFAQEIEMRKDEHPSIELVSVNNCSIEITSEAPLENSVSSLVENIILVPLIPININNSSQETVIKEERLTSDSSLPDKSKSEVDSDSNSSFEIDNFEVDNTSIDIQRPSQSNFIHDQPKYQVIGLFFDVKSPISKTEGMLLEDSVRSPNHQMMHDLTTQNLDDEAKNSKVDTPNTSAAKVTIESVLSLAEIAGCGKESMRQNNNGDLTSTLNSISVKNLSMLTSSAANKKPAECLSFFDISAENVGSLNESQSSACRTPEISEFLQYRDLSSDQDNRSEDTLSESKSILKTDVSEYPSDASNDTEGEESNSSPTDCSSPVSSPDAVPDASNFKNNYNTYVVKTECSWDDAITRQRFCQEDDGECDARSAQDNQTDISTKNIQLKGWMLDPVVNLGERCDNKSFIDMNSSVSADSVSIPTNLDVLPDIKTEDEEINETRPFKSNEALTVDQLLTAVNETAIKLEAIEQSTSDTGKHDEIEKVNSDVKMEIQPGHKDVKELSLVADQELTVSDEDQESVELTSEKDLSQDHKAARYDKGPKLTICDNDQLSIELTREKELSKDQKITVCDKGQELPETRKERELSLSMKLRKRPVTAVQTEKSMPNEGSSVLNQDSPATRCMNLRSRNPSTSSSQRKSASADEGSSVVNQDTPATQYMNLRSRNP
ncbi:hypothetical protein AVEN_51980-1, partial [Araneus ventricosus]